MRRGISITLGPDEAAILETVAFAEGLKPTKWLRRVIRAAVEEAIAAKPELAELATERLERSRHPAGAGIEERRLRLVRNE